ncbi:hypothetical protein MPH_07684 [Macrophomina phaseolina MS6]|uniref:Uncharacterized protein n=1 Tax=Macrophomina phaseolina (strain MS6) TaxID=1126212 RepID=K2RY65_MACPH|nr:hypothetical protein MPH_07684 [Macrophomina phaseolina MS6]
MISDPGIFVCQRQACEARTSFPAWVKPVLLHAAKAGGTLLSEINPPLAPQKPNPPARPLFEKTAKTLSSADSLVRQAPRQVRLPPVTIVEILTRWFVRASLVLGWVRLDFSHSSECGEASMARGLHGSWPAETSVSRQARKVSVSSQRNSQARLPRG